MSRLNFRPSDTFWSRRRLRIFTIIAAIILIALIFWLHHGPYPDIIKVFAVVGIFAISYAMATMAKDPADYLWETILNMFVATAFGILVIGLDGEVNLAEDYAVLVAAAITVFAVQAMITFSETIHFLEDGVDEAKKDMSERLRRFDQSLDSHIELHKELESGVRNLSNVTSSVEQWVGASNYATMAATALDLKDKAMKRYVEDLGHDGTELLAGGVRSHLGVLGVWLNSGHDLKERTAKLAWLRLLQVYGDEEIFDVGRRELATNVRNYAYLLLAMIETFRAKEVEDNNQLVLINCSPFAIKDFFNFPNGRAGSRFYHEPEFYGTYRRVLGEALRRGEGISAFRIVMAADWAYRTAKDSTKEGEAIQFDGSVDFSELGWPVDCLEKLILDCANYRFSNDIRKFTVGTKPDFESFSKGDPRQRLYHYQPSAIYWQPVSRRKKPPMGYQPITALWKSAGIPGSAIDADMLVRAITRHGASSTLEEAPTDEINPEVSQISLKSHIDKIDSERIEKKGKLGELYRRLVSEDSAPLTKMVAAHELDSVLASEGVFRPGKLPRSSTGVDLGPAEAYLHEALIEDKRESTTIYRDVLDLFAADLLGLETAQVAELPERLRIAVVNRREKDHATLAERLLEEGIQPEFLLIARCSQDCKTAEVLDEMEPLALVTADMNEPFHTCRVQIRFAENAGPTTDPQVRDPLTKYTELVRATWRDSQDDTKQFLEAVDRMKSTLNEN